MSRTPIDLSFEELAAAARAASERADNEARQAGVKVAGRTARRSAVMVSLAAHMCKWPIGDPASESFTVCGRKAVDASPYCIDHARIALTTSKPKTTKPISRQSVRGSRRA